MDATPTPTPTTKRPTSKQAKLGDKAINKAPAIKTIDENNINNYYN